jgi:2,5-diketo-D-gluconate reductase A
MTGAVPDVRLNNGTTIPQVGFGVFRVPDDETERAVLAAIEAGYRSIDTAALYGNEEGVGRAVASCGLPREELFVSTKLWNDDQGYDSTLRAFDASLRRLGLDHVDLYLVHWPKPSLDRYVETWRAFEALAADGRARAIGVSNFPVAHLQRLLDETRVVPAVNQIELHTRLQQESLRRFHAAHGIVTEAWSPLGQGQALAHPVVTDLARRLGRTPAQVVLRWHVQLGNVVIPKSTTPSRIRENLALFDFALDEADMVALARLEAGERMGPDPDERDMRPRQGFSSTRGRWVPGS